MSRRLHLEGLDDLVAELARRPTRPDTIAADLAFLAEHREDQALNEALRRKSRSEPWCYVREHGADRP